MTKTSATSAHTETSFTPPLAASVGNQFIREWRQHGGLTVKQLGEKAGLTGSMIAQLERGTTGYTKRSLEAIAKALNVPAWQLLAFPPEDAGASFVQEAAEIWDGIPEPLRPLARQIINRQAENIRAFVKLVLVASRQSHNEHAAA